QSQQEIGRPRYPGTAGETAEAAGRRGHPARFVLWRAEHRAGTGSIGPERSVSKTGDGADDAVRRRWPVGRLQGIGPDPPRAGRGDDELRLRPRSEPAL